MKQMYSSIVDFKTDRPATCTESRAACSAFRPEPPGNLDETHRTKQYCLCLIYYVCWECPGTPWPPCGMYRHHSKSAVGIPVALLSLSPRKSRPSTHPGWHVRRCFSPPILRWAQASSHIVRASCVSMPSQVPILLITH